MYQYQRNWSNNLIHLSWRHIVTPVGGSVYMTKTKTKMAKQSKNTLHLEGELTVAGATILHEQFVQLLRHAEHIEIDISKVTKIDLACLQLFCSAHRTAMKDGKAWKMKSDDNLAFLVAGEEAGLNYYTKCVFDPSKDCLWKRETEGSIENG